MSIIFVRILQDYNRKPWTGIVGNGGIHSHKQDPINERDKKARVAGREKNPQFSKWKASQLHDYSFRNCQLPFTSNSTSETRQPGSRYHISAIKLLG